MQISVKPGCMNVIQTLNNSYCQIVRLFVFIRTQQNQFNGVLRVVAAIEFCEEGSKFIIESGLFPSLSPPSSHSLRSLSLVIPNNS